MTKLISNRTQLNQGWTFEKQVGRLYSWMKKLITNSTLSNQDWTIEIQVGRLYPWMRKLNYKPYSVKSVLKDKKIGWKIVSMIEKTYSKLHSVTSRLNKLKYELEDCIHEWENLFQIVLCYINTKHLKSYLTKLYLSKKKNWIKICKRKWWRVRTTIAKITDWKRNIK